MLTAAIIVGELLSHADDLPRFPDHKATAAMRSHIASLQRDLETWRALNMHREADYDARREWLARCYKAWDTLDDAHHATVFHDTLRVAQHMARLHAMLPGTAYWRGLMPVEDGTYAAVRLRQ